jgi:hypothetical protein
MLVADVDALGECEKTGDRPVLSVALVGCEVAIGRSEFTLPE